MPRKPRDPEIWEFETHTCNGQETLVRIDWSDRIVHRAVKLRAPEDVPPAWGDFNWRHSPVFLVDMMNSYHRNVKGFRGDAPEWVFIMEQLLADRTLVITKRDVERMDDEDFDG